MKKHNEEEKFELKVRPRPKETVKIEIPGDTLNSLKKIAVSRDMSVEALIKFYIGQSLRHDLSKLFADRALETTAHALTGRVKNDPNK